MQSITFGWDTAKEHDQAVGHQLFDRHAGTQRTVEKLPDGIRTLTVSSDPVTVSLLHDHVSAMESRMRQGLVMRRWDPFCPNCSATQTRSGSALKTSPTESASKRIQIIRMWFRCSICMRMRSATLQNGDGMLPKNVTHCPPKPQQ